MMSMRIRLEALEAALAGRDGAEDEFTVKARRFVASLGTPDLRRLVELIEKQNGGGELDAAERGDWARLNQIWDGVGQ